jgi:hypothetical protein
LRGEGITKGIIMAFDDWIKDENGNLKMTPIVGWESAVFASMGCMLRIQFVRSLDQLGKKRDAVQLAMTPDQARELADDLLQMANKIELRVPPAIQRS